MAKSKVVVVGDFLEYKGKWYRRGDEVPMSEADFAHMQASGSRTLRLESDEPEVVAVASVGGTAAPTDDAGQPITTPAARKVAEEAAAEPAPLVAAAVAPAEHK